MFSHLVFFTCFAVFHILCRDKVVDFHWNASDPWTVVSVSDDCDTTGGGGTLQVSDFILIGILFPSDKIIVKTYKWDQHLDTIAFQSI